MKMYMTECLRLISYVNGYHYKLYKPCYMFILDIYPVWIYRAWLQVMDLHIIDIKVGVSRYPPVQQDNVQGASKG